VEGKLPESEANQERDEMSRGRKNPLRDWESSIEKAIREAMERGDFQDLTGRGKPLDLTSNPHTPPEWDLAFKLLQDAGFAPEWIELDKEIRVANSQILKPFQDYLARPSETRSYGQSREAKLIADFRIRAAELNRLIDDFNLKAPSPRLHHPRIPIEGEVEKFRAAVEKGRA
jgi:DnaJ homolog subfamily C member 28